jgi:outer membrane receptor protein involved in Fe transport
MTVPLAALLLTSVLAQGSECRLSGVIVDISGAAVPHARITLELPSGATEITAGPEGRFCVATLPDGDVVLRVRAAGFGESLQPVRVRNGPARPVRIVLRPAPISETVAVTATRAEARLDSPASVSVLPSAMLLSSAAATLDDALKSVPGFTLFRRSSSRVANPTAQGVTMRGLSASGASRTLVLSDGVPLNDPFGGWVYWDRVPVAAIDRIEVVRGGSSDLYGTYALGGVIQVLTFDGSRSAARALIEAGQRDTGRLSAYGGAQRGAWQGSAALEWAGTDGYPIVAADQRGDVDRPAASRYRSGLVSAAWQRDPRLRLEARANVFTEARENGTPLQRNDTNARRGTMTFSGVAGRGAWTVQAFGASQGYNQTFTAVSADRRSENLTVAQHVPADEVGFSAHWAGALSRAEILAGVEGRQVAGESRETRFAGGAPLPPQPFGGRQHSGAMFGQLTWRASDRLTIVAGGRGELWESKRLGALGRDRREVIVTPRTAVSWRATSGVSIRGSVYRSFRAPTLNELHRGFRVGNVVTSANAELAPEKAVGAEGGVLLSRGQLSLRAVGFWTDLNDAVANVTLSTSGSLIQRQRMNAGTVRAAGVEVEAELRPTPAVLVSLSATTLRSRFAAGSDAALLGHRVPQVPTYQLAAAIRYASPAFTVTADVRALGAQFEDDRNTLRLDPSTMVDVMAERRVRDGARVFVAVENVFDVEQQVGRTPLLNIGLPRTARVGVRLFIH